MSSPKHIEKSTLYEFIKGWLNEGLLLSTGDTWEIACDFQSFALIEMQFFRQKVARSSQDHYTRISFQYFGEICGNFRSAWKYCGWQTQHRFTWWTYGILPDRRAVCIGCHVWWVFVGWCETLSKFKMKISNPKNQRWVWASMHCQNRTPNMFKLWNSKFVNETQQSRC